MCVTLIQVENSLSMFTKTQTNTHNYHGDSHQALPIHLFPLLSVTHCSALWQCLWCCFLFSTMSCRSISFQSSKHDRLCWVSGATVWFVTGKSLLLLCQGKEIYLPAGIHTVCLHSSRENSNYFASHFIHYKMELSELCCMSDSAAAFHFPSTCPTTQALMTTASPHLQSFLPLHILSSVHSVVCHINSSTTTLSNVGSSD